MTNRAGVSDVPCTLSAHLRYDRINLETVQNQIRNFPFILPNRIPSYAKCSITHSFF